MKHVYHLSIIDPNSLSCEGLKHVLHGRNFQIVDVSDSVERALEKISPDVHRDAILINLSRHSLPSQQLMGRLRKTFPNVRIALIQESCDPERIQDAIRIGLDGFILETINIDAFSKAIELIMLGERLFPPFAAGKECAADKLIPAAPAPAALSALSASELRVLALLAQARPNKVIARDLGVSESTVKVHVKAILRKTESRNRTDAALLVRDVGAKAFFEGLAHDLPVCSEKMRGQRPTGDGVSSTGHRQLI